MLRRTPLSSPWVFLEQFAPHTVLRIQAAEKPLTLAEECKAIEELAEACEVIEALLLDDFAKTGDDPRALAGAFLERAKSERKP